MPPRLAGAVPSRLTPPCRRARSSTSWARVATTGRHRRRPRPGPTAALALAVAALSALGLAVAGCSQLHGSGAAAARTRAVPRASPAAVAARPVFCQVAQARVSAAPGRLVPRSDGRELVPLGASGTGRVAYVSAWTSGFAGVAD